MNSSKKSSDSSLTLYHYLDTYPDIAEGVFLAPGVKIIGDVKIGSGSSVWFNSVIRGDVHYIRIGDKTNIQDCSMLHVTNNKYPLNIGNEVTIGHSVNLHGCTLEDKCFVGIGAIVLDGAVIESTSMIAAGTVVKQNFVVPKGKLAAGVPAKIIRELSDSEIDDITASAERYSNYSILMNKSITNNLQFI